MVSRSQSWSRFVGTKEVIDENLDWPSSFRPTGKGCLFDGIGGKLRNERSIGEEGGTRLERVNGVVTMGGGGDSGFQSIPRNDRFSLRVLRFVLTFSCFGVSRGGVGGPDTASELLPNNGVPV